MKNLVLILFILFSSLILGCGLHDTAFAFNSSQANATFPIQDQIAPFNFPYPKNPVIITQVELATPLESGYTPTVTCTTYQNGTKVCNTLESPYRKDVNSPYYNIKCSFYNSYSKCDLVHQSVRLNSTCNIHGIDLQGNQWIEIYNNLNSTAYLTDFGTTRIINQTQNMQGTPEYEGADYRGTKTLIMKPHESCFIGFFGMPGEDVLFPLNDSSVAISYNYKNSNYIAATPFLTDTYNDSRTWQFDGNTWVFAEHNMVSVPEFPLATLVLIISIGSVIVFYKLGSLRIKT